MIERDYNFGESVTYGVGSGLGKRENGLSPPHANGAGRGGGAVQSAANKGS